MFDDLELDLRRSTERYVFKKSTSPTPVLPKEVFRAKIKAMKEKYGTTSTTYNRTPRQ
jgi:hypothetical protein